MNPFLPSLLDEINALISNPPAPLNTDYPPYIADTPETDEQVMMHLTTLEKLTGIFSKAMPTIFELNEEECHLLAVAFKKLFEALNICIVDLPHDFPDDAFIALILYNWDKEILYIPFEGYLFECCTGDNETCPYGKKCLFCSPEAIHSDEIFKPGCGGFFRDDGTQVDPLTVHIPDLCLDCVSFMDEDRERNILCTLSRMSYDGKEEFICYAFRRVYKSGK